MVSSSEYTQKKGRKLCKTVKLGIELSVNLKHRRAMAISISYTTVIRKTTIILPEFCRHFLFSKGKDAKCSAFYPLMNKMFPWKFSIFYARFTVSMKLARNFLIQRTRNLRLRSKKYRIIFLCCNQLKTEGKRSIFFLDVSLASGMLYHSRLSTCPLLCDINFRNFSLRSPFCINLFN